VWNGNWCSHVVSFNPACRWCVDVGCVVNNTTKIFRPKHIDEKFVNKIHHKYWSALICYLYRMIKKSLCTLWCNVIVRCTETFWSPCILRVWLIHGRWNILKNTSESLVELKIDVVWKMTPFRRVNCSWRFEGQKCLHLQGYTVQEETFKKKAVCSFKGQQLFTIRGSV
jgi:hypothetical protein